MAVLNHSSSLLMKMQVLNCCLKQGWLVPSLHPKLSMKLPNFPVTLHPPGSCQQILQAQGVAQAKGRRGSEQQGLNQCVQKREGEGSAWECRRCNERGEGCSLLLLCCACRGIWGIQVHAEPEKHPGNAEPSEVRSLGTPAHLNISWEQQFLSGLRHPL